MGINNLYHAVGIFFGEGLRLAALLLMFSLTACLAANPNYLRKDLANKGPLMLSRENPFLAPNLLLARERDSNTLVEQFLQHRGEPDAIEVRTQLFRPLKMYFFYLETMDAYLFQEREDSWLVFGPERIPEVVLRKFALVLPSSAPQQHHSKRPPLPSRHSPGIPPRNQEAAVDDLLEQFDEFETPPQAANSLGQGEVVAQESAGLHSGDIIHTITFPGETMRIIAHWFTGNADNSARIARINSIQNPDLLFLGQNIRIPRYLLRRTDPLPRAEVERYLKSLSSP